MSSAYTEQDLRISNELLAEFGIFTSIYPQTAQFRVRLAAEFSRIRSEACAGMREACADAASQDAQAILTSVGNIQDTDAGDEIDEDLNRIEKCSLRVTGRIRYLPGLAADEAIERIKAESYEKGMQAGAKDEALLQYIFDEPGPIKDGIERIKREARLDELNIISNLMEECYVGQSQDPDDVEFDEGQFVAAMNKRRAALSGKETEHD